jgi:sugar/nucleoside kinase (ribokinase family)
VETGLTAYQVVGKRLYAGAAGSVLCGLAALGAGAVYAVGFSGDDGEGFDMRRKLGEAGITIDEVLVSGKVMTPVYTKPVFLRGKRGAEFGAPDYKIEETNRLDHRNINPTPRSVEDRIIASIEKLTPELDAIIALDQLTVEGHGVITPRVREALAETAARNPRLVLYADSRAFIAAFRNSIIKCNDHEALLMVRGKAPPPGEDADTVDAGACLMELAKNSGKEVFVSCGRRGVLVREGNAPRLIPAIPVSGPIDIVGAGDACSAGIVSALCAGAGAAEAACMGNLTASIAIQVIGAAGTASRGQVRARYREALE